MCLDAIPAYMARMLEGAMLFQIRASGKKCMNSPSSQGGEGVSKSTKITFVYICPPTSECECSCPPCRNLQKRILEETQKNNDDDGDDDQIGDVQIGDTQIGDTQQWPSPVAKEWLQRECRIAEGSVKDRIVTHNRRS